MMSIEFGANASNQSDKINLALPVAGKTDKGEEIDKVYEGDFLVTQLRHQFGRAPEVHMIHMSVV